jgi:anti-anti-sigma regulatory factor
MITIHNSSDDIALVFLHEMRLHEELETLHEIVSEEADFDLILSFALVEILTSPNISSLIILQSLLLERGRRLILCNVTLPTKGIFVAAGLCELFNFADDRAAAIEALWAQNVPKSDSCARSLSE